MNNKLLPPPTEMCEPVITGSNFISEPEINWSSVHLTLSNNTYKSFVRLFAKWKSQETLFINGKFIRRNNYATGRIKRMRSNKNLKGIGFFIYKYERYRYSGNTIPRYPLTRWNKH